MPEQRNGGLGRADVGLPRDRPDAPRRPDDRLMRRPRPFRWLRLYLVLSCKTRYWQRRARLAELKLEAERRRNMGREDDLVSRIATSRGTYGVAARTGPAYQPPRPAEVWQPPPLPDLNSLTPPEREEHAFYLRNAAEYGVPATQATQDFLADLAQRRRPIDEGEIG